MKDVASVTSDVGGTVRDGTSAPYGRLRRIPTRGAYGSIPFAGSFLVRGSRALRRAHRREPFDVVHVHSAYASLGSVSYLLRGVNVPRVFSLYSPNFRTTPGHDCNGGGVLRARVARTALRGYDVIVSPSEYLRSRLMKIGLAEEDILQVVPALAPAMLRDLPSKADARAALSLPQDAPVVLFLGNYSPWKGADVLLKAFERVRRSVPDAVLLTAWGEPYEWSGNRRAELLDLVQALGLQGSVRQSGILPDVRVALRAADVLASPFRCTCKVLDYPLSILEAMACGLPVVSTSVGGIPEILGRDGRGTTVPPGDEGALADALAGLLADPAEARGIGARGHAWVRERFAVDGVGRALDALYSGLSRERIGPQTHRVPSPN